MVKMSSRRKAVFLILLTLGGLLPLSFYLTTPAHGLVRFNSISGLEHFLLTKSRCGSYYGYQRNGQLLQLYGVNPGLGPTYGPAILGAQSGAAGPSNVNAAPSHSETNAQVAGVDELDTVKTDGQYIYTVTNDTVVIVRAYPASGVKVLSRISVGNQTIDGIFVKDNRLAIVSEAPRTVYSIIGPCGIRQVVHPAQPTAIYNSIISAELQNTSIWVYDLEERSSPILLTAATINGTFVGARLIGDLVYLVSSTPAWYQGELPRTIVNGNAAVTLPTQVYHSDVSDAAFSYTTVLGLNITQNNVTPTVETFLLGTSSTIYVSLTNIYLTQPIWSNQEGTVIHRISINDASVRYEATGLVQGHVLNQFSMDEYGDYFRVATSSSYGSGTNVYVLTKDLKSVGGLEGLSPGEVFHAARFMGDRAYLVTFKRLDPLFVVDLQNPARPAVLGQLNVTGVSDYLEPYDETHLIGIGKSAEEVTWENAALFLGLKISLFDVGDPNHPAEMSRFLVGDRGTDSPALTDHKAVLFDRSKNLLVIPVQVVGQTGPSIKSPTWYTEGSHLQGAYVFSVTLQNGIVFRGSITHLPIGQLPDYTNTAYFVTRALYIGNFLYTISNEMVKINSLVDLQEIGSVDLL